jgi:hypothetical protein
MRRIPHWRDLADQYRLKAACTLRSGSQLAVHALAECADSVADRLERAHSFRISEWAGMHQTASRMRHHLQLEAAQSREEAVEAPCPSTPLLNVLLVALALGQYHDVLFDPRESTLRVGCGAVPRCSAGARCICVTAETILIADFRGRSSASGPRRKPDAGRREPLERARS